MSAVHFLATFPSNFAKVLAKNIVIDENNVFRDEKRFIILMLITL
jgi:hypothetical protein